jgi:hypothetical protein
MFNPDCHLWFEIIPGFQILEFLWYVFTLLVVIWVAIKAVRLKIPVSIFLKLASCLLLLRLLVLLMWNFPSCNAYDCILNRIVWCLLFSAMCLIMYPWMQMVSISKTVMSPNYSKTPWIQRHFRNMLVAANVLLYSVNILLLALAGGCVRGSGDSTTRQNIIVAVQNLVFAGSFCVISGFFLYCIIAVNLDAVPHLKWQIWTNCLMLVLVSTLRCVAFFYAQYRRVTFNWQPRDPAQFLPSWPSEVWELAAYMIPECLPLLLQSCTELRRVGATHRVPLRAHHAGSRAC